jgi:uncharacterized protein YbbC (DUF1343 family)
LCGGVQLHVIDKQAFRPVQTGLTLLYVINELSDGKFSFNKSATAAAPTIDIYTGDSNVRLGVPLVEIERQWDQEAARFKAMSQKYYLYK